MLAEVFGADARELRALQDFVAYKEKCVERFQNVEKNLEAIDQAKWLADYLEEFPEQDRSTAADAPFWPKDNKVQTQQPKMHLQLLLKVKVERWIQARWIL